MHAKLLVWSRRTITGLLCVVVILALGVTSVLLHWRLSGKQVLGVQTGSMRPSIQPGDAVVVRPLGPGQRQSLRPGQVIAYRSLANPRVVVTHRVATIDQRTGWVTTKGDALPARDPVVPPRLIVGRVEAVAPKLGLVLATARQPLVLLLAVYMPALAIISVEIRRLYGHFADQLYRYHGVRSPGFRSHAVSSGKL